MLTRPAGMLSSDWTGRRAWKMNAFRRRERGEVVNPSIVHLGYYGDAESCGAWRKLNMNTFGERMLSKGRERHLIEGVSCKSINRI